MNGQFLPALEQQQSVRVGVEMVAANKIRNGQEDFVRETLHGSHVDCARQVREYRRECRLDGESS